MFSLCPLTDMAAVLANVPIGSHRPLISVQGHMAGGFHAPAAQVYLRNAELAFNAEHVDVLHYDHALHLLMAVRRQSISLYNVPSSDQPLQVSKQEMSRTCIHVPNSPQLLTLQKCHLMASKDNRGDYQQTRCYKQQQICLPPSSC